LFDFVAVLGRGIQRLSEVGPNSLTASWTLTQDLEVCDKDSAHLPIRVPVDDDSPYCMVGGGDMNVEAGVALIRLYKPTLVVCAYGGRSKYLESIGAPSESEVMSDAMHYDPRLDGVAFNLKRWTRERQLPVPSNTRQELLNIFDLALESSRKRIALVTVGVHVPRTATYITKHLSVYPKYRDLSPVLFESEEVLLAADRRYYGPRVEALRNSKSFARNWEREAVGISKIVRDVYGDAKPTVEVPEMTAQ
jgi:hypothetical protein